MTKKIDPTVSAAVDGIFTDAKSTVTSRIDALRTQRAQLTNQRDGIQVQISTIDAALEECRLKVMAIQCLESQKAGTLYP